MNVCCLLCCLALSLVYSILGTWISMELCIFPYQHRRGPRPTRAQKGLTVYSVGHRLPSKRGLSFHIFLSSSPLQYNHLGGRTNVGICAGLGRIGVTSPPLLASLPAQCLRTHYHCAYEQQYVFYKKLYDVFFCPVMSFCWWMFWVMDSIPRVRCASGNVLKAASTAVYLSFMTISVFDFNFDQRLSNTYIFWVHNRSNMPMFCLKKNHFSALGGPDVAIFGRDDLDPLYFDVSNFSVPPDPPICLKMPKCTMFTTFWDSHLKHTHKVGVRREKFNIGNVAQFF